MIARIGFPSSRVASRQLVPYGLSSALWKIFDITTDVIVSSTENYGIRRGAIEVPRISDRDRRGPTAIQVPQRSQAAMSELRQNAHLKQRMSDVSSSLGGHAIKLNQQS